MAKGVISNNHVRSVDLRQRPWRWGGHRRKGLGRATRCRRQRDTLQMSGSLRWVRRLIRESKETGGAGSRRWMKWADVVHVRAVATGSNSRCRWRRVGQVTSPVWRLSAPLTHVVHVIRCYRWHIGQASGAVSRVANSALYSPCRSSRHSCPACKSAFTASMGYWRRRR